MHSVYSLSGLLLRNSLWTFIEVMVENKQVRQRNLQNTKFRSDILFGPQRPLQKCAFVAIILWNACYLASIVSLARNRIPVFLRLAQLWLESRRMGNVQKETPGTCHKYKQRVLRSLAHRTQYDLLTGKKEALDWEPGPALSNTSWVYFINPNNGKSKFTSGQRSHQLVCLKDKEFPPLHTPGASNWFKRVNPLNTEWELILTQTLLYSFELEKKIVHIHGVSVVFALKNYKNLHKKLSFNSVF